MKMGVPAKKVDRRYTYADYREWPEDERWELIDGVAWDMSPAPSTSHQAVLGELMYRIQTYLRDSDCVLYVAPFDVLLPDADGQIDDEVPTVVQPDLSVICDRAKLTSWGCTGAPDWIIEILSPYTAHKDLHGKLELYQRHGVREYWLVDPGNRCLHVYTRGDDGRYSDPEVWVAPAEVRTAVLPGLVLDLITVFDAVPAHLRG